MKTFVRLIRRYVLAAVGIVLLLLFSGVAVLGWLGWQEGCRLPQREYSSSEIADSMVETAEGLAFGAERTPQEWMNGYEWAMVLDDVGNIRWSYGLPQDLNHAYTPGDIAKFARWYLADYPVFCWTEPYGLFVIGLPKGSLWKYSIYSSPDFVLSMARVLPAAALGLLLLGLVLCFWLSWRGAKRLEAVANGLAEAVKAGLLADPELFSIFEKEDVDDRIGDIICRSLRFKKSIVEQDETEQGMRKALNFGHTIGHGIEAVKGIKGRRTTGLFHGECVALGMLPMIESKALQKRVRGVYRRLGLPTRTAYDKEKVLAEMLHDKKAQSGQITIIKVPGLGCWRAETIPVEGLRPLLGMED